MSDAGWAELVRKNESLLSDNEALRETLKLAESALKSGNISKASDIHYCSKCSIRIDGRFIRKTLDKIKECLGK